MDPPKVDSSQQARVYAKYRRQTQELQHLRRSSRHLAFTLGALVLTIYGYSMYKIKQETVLDEIDAEIGQSKS